MQRSHATTALSKHAAGVSCRLKELSTVTKCVLGSSLERFVSTNWNSSTKMSFPLLSPEEPHWQQWTLVPQRFSFQFYSVENVQTFVTDGSVSKRGTKTLSLWSFGFQILKWLNTHNNKALFIVQSFVSLMLNPHFMCHPVTFRGHSPRVFEADQQIKLSCLNSKNLVIVNK